MQVSVMQNIFKINIIYFSQVYYKYIFQYCILFYLLVEDLFYQMIIKLKNRIAEHDIIS